MTARPLVTVCIPTYNRPGMLRESLQSVLWQSYRNLEVIVSDNASSTDTAAVVEAFGDDRVRVDRLDHNVGLHGNLTRCLHLGTGEYRVMLPDDDLMLPGNVESKVAILQAHPEVGLVHSAFRYINDESLPYGPVNNWALAQEDEIKPGNEYIRESIARGGITCVSSVMLRSDLVAGEAFVLEDGPYCDLALWLRVAQRADVAFLVAPLAGYRVHPSSASSAFQTMKEIRGRVVLTPHHADALKLAFSRYLENADLDADQRDEYRQLQRRSDLKMRVSISVNRHVPRPLLRLARRSLNAIGQGRIYRAVSIYSAYAPEPVDDGTVLASEGLPRP